MTEKRKKTLNLSLEPEVIEMAARLASRERRSVSNMVEVLIAREDARFAAVTGTAGANGAEHPAGARLCDCEKAA
jgi:hypothetical protein